MRLHIKSPRSAPGFYPLVTRGRDLKHLSFGVLELGGSFITHHVESGEEELAIDFYNGPVRVEARGAFGKWTAEAPVRKSLRDAHPMVYIPAGAAVTLSAVEGPARATITGALGKPGGKPELTGPCLTNTVGKDNWTRLVYTHIADNIDAAHLIAGETVNDPGGWSSCPPHKHDRFTATEAPMEEVYYFQCDPKQGFGFIRVYTDPSDPEPFDHAFAVEDGDTVLIPRGYHPVATCPGYTLHYTWILAGEGRKYGAWTDDPRHAWIKQ